MMNFSPPPVQAQPNLPNNSALPAIASPQGIKRLPVFDILQQRRPIVLTADTERTVATFLLTHPWFAKTLNAVLATPKAQAAQKTSQESASEQKAMAVLLRKSLSAAGKTHFDNLLKAGTLLEIGPEETHTPLYWLYSILTTPRADGFSAQSVLENTVRLLDRPFEITQRFDPLSELSTQAILEAATKTDAQGNTPMPLQQPLTAERLHNSSSALCVASAVMYEMADRHPAKLARQINGLTSPAKSFFEPARFEDISPDDPSQALNILKLLNIEHYQSAPNTVTVKATLPELGYWRAVNDGKVAGGRSEVEAVYQATFSNMAVRGAYNAATDERSNLYTGSPAAVFNSKSLTEAQKNELWGLFDAGLPPWRLQQVVLAALESPAFKTISAEDKTAIIEGLTVESKGIAPHENAVVASILGEQGALIPITYQVSDINPKVPGGDRETYLYGYNSPFTTIQEDLLSALNQNQFVMIGYIESSWDGQVSTGHEIKLTGYFKHPQTGELHFLMADSDDGNPMITSMSARELIPKLHHAYYPLSMARSIQNRIQPPNVPPETNAQVYLPDASDEVSYRRIPLAPLSNLDASQSVSEPKNIQTKNIQSV